MALFDDSLIHQITELIEQRYQTFGNALGIQSSPASLPPKVDKVEEQSVLQRDLKLLIGVANSEFTRSTEMVHKVEQALTRVLNLLLGTVLNPKPTFSEDLWQSDIGIVISRARWWISGDELITISNAASLAFGANTQSNRMRIARAIDSGLLEWVIDPSVANPMHNRRVLRSQVERLGELRRLPE